MPRIDDERWVPVPDWPDYEVSVLGRVRSKPMLRKAGRAGWRWTKGKILKQTYSSYIVAVKLHNAAGEEKTAGVANLVLRAFVGPPGPGQVARHFINPDPFCCRLYNLRWGTESENALDAVRHGTHGTAGKTRSAETRARIGAAHKGMKHTEESKAKNAAAQTGKKHSAATRAKMSAAHQEYWAQHEGEGTERTAEAVAEAARIKRARRPQ